MLTHAKHIEITGSPVSGKNAKITKCTEWIPVNLSELPCDEDTCEYGHSARMILCSGNLVFIGSYDFESNVWNNEFLPALGIEPTHWMPLPEPLTE